MNSFKETKCEDFYAILSGFFRFSQFKNGLSESNSHFIPWDRRINGGNSKSTFDFLKNNYYDSYLQNIFPEVRDIKLSKTSEGVKFLEHLTYEKCISDPDSFKNLILNAGSPNPLQINIEYIDIYLFPNNLGIITFKLVFSDSNFQTIGRVSDLINKIRIPEVQLLFPDGKSLSMKDFIERNIINFSENPIDLKEYTPQFKAYTNINLNEEYPDTETDQLLFDLGNVSPLGSAKGETAFSPASGYYDDMMKNNTIRVFKNWSALALYDTFTRISTKFPDTYKSWEYDYFHIYVYCLYMKFNIYVINSKISDITTLSSTTHKLRDEFIEFINDYYHSQISYKFLPDIIKDKIQFSFDMQTEIERMETKVVRINSYAQEKREKTMNIILITITLLNIISFAKDSSDWMVNLGVRKTFVYPSFSLVLESIIIISLLIFYLIKRKK